MFLNRYNWAALARVPTTFKNPVRVFRAILSGTALPEVWVNTPVGPTRIKLRNFESLKTVFSVFCRRDYPIGSTGPHLFLDIGSNVGVAATFFLTRNAHNRAQCYEPDSNNLAFLIDNMAQFKDRAVVHSVAVGEEAGQMTLFRSEDGKYTSLLQTEDFVDTEAVSVIPFVGILDQAHGDADDIIVKIDIEGLEPALVRSADFSRYPKITRMIIESLECSALIGRPHSRAVRSGYVEDIAFA